MEGVGLWTALGVVFQKAAGPPPDDMMFGIGFSLFSSGR